jgi:hypothetical protein
MGATLTFLSNFNLFVRCKRLFQRISHAFSGIYQIAKLPLLRGLRAREGTISLV